MATQLVAPPPADFWYATPRLTGTSSRAVTVLDREGIIRYQSAPIRSLIGYKAETLIGRSIYSLLDAPSGHRVRETVRSFTRGDQRFDLWELHMRTVSGSYGRLTGRATNFLQDPRLSGVLVCISRDRSIQ